MAGTQDWIAGPFQRFVSDASAAALGSPRRLTAVEKEEIDWERKNSAGYAFSDPNDPFRLILWNFAVASATLKSEHQSALAARFRTLILDPTLTVALAGHASSTGSEKANTALSEGRAKAAQQYLLAFGVSADAFATVEGRGSSEPIKTGDDGQSLAWNRSVEITLGYPQVAGPPTQVSATPLPTVTYTPLGPDPRVPGTQGGGSLEFGWRFPLGIVETPWVMLRGQFDGRVKVVFQGPVPPDIRTTFAVTGSDNAGNPQFAPSLSLGPQINDAIKAKFTAQLNPARGASGGPTLQAQGGIEWDSGGLLPAGGISFQSDPTFPVSFYLQTKWTPAGSITFPNGTTAALQFQGKFILSAGLGPKTLKILANQVMRYFTGIGAEEAGAEIASSALAAFVEATAAAMGAVVVAAVIILGTIYLIQDQTEAGFRQCQLWARRNGYACGVAALVLGQGDAAAKAYINAYPKEANVDQEAARGYNLAFSEIQNNPVALKKLTDRFGKLSFNDCREAVFQALGGMQGADEPSLRSLSYS